MKQALCVLERRMFQGEGATRQSPSEGLLGVSMQEPEVEMLETRGKGEGCGGGRSRIRMWEELDSPSAVNRQPVEATEQREEL